MHLYLARFGAFGHVAPFSTESSAVYQRGEQVVCRTKRGLEIAEVLTEIDEDQISPELSTDQLIAGKILRRLSEQDRLLRKRLDQNRLEAIEHCAKKLKSLNVDASLMDAELLFDGKSLFFYFLGNVNGELDALTSELTEIYEGKVQFREFTKAVDAGCGPLCGTEEASGCSTGGGCGSCSLSGNCSTN